MNPDARALCHDYPQLKMPVVIVAGAEDHVVDSEQSTKLHRDIPDSILHLIPATGHMVHQTATAEILCAIDTATNQRRRALVRGAVCAGR